MARSRNKSKRKGADESRWSGEGMGILFAGTGVLLLLSLISYTPGDLPIKFPFTDWTLLGSFALDMEANHPRQNWIGPVGTLIGFGQIQLFGVAAYLLPLGLIWLGVGRLFLGASFSMRTWIGFAVCLVSGASLMSVQNSFFTTWQETYLIAGTGGVIGEGLGIAVLKGLLNSMGSIIVLGMIYWLSFFTLLGVHPIKFVKELFLWTAEKSGELREAWAARAEEKNSSASSRATPKKKPASRKKNGKQRNSLAEADEEDEGQWEYEEETDFEEDGEGQSQLPLQELPEPQIIDATQRITPTLAAGAKPFERKQPKQHAALSTEGFEDYELPGFDLLEYDEEEAPPEDNTDALITQQTKIVETLKAFGVDVTAGDITRGPTITRYEVYPSVGLRVSRIAQLEPDLARATKAERINILAPIPGKDTVGIEIANDSRMPVALRELLQDDEFRSSKRKIPLALGKDVYGKAVIGDLAAMPHLLVAGATGSGKSVCINSIISSILFKFGPDELRFIMIDPKVVEMQIYSDLPHLVVPVVTDPRKVVGALKWCVNEMERRYKIFAREGVRNFDSFNNRVREDGEYELGAEEEEEPEEEEEIVDEEHVESIAAALADGELGPEDGDWEEDEEEEIPDRFPYIVVIIDELADLMQTAPADVEMCIARIAQKARAAGIHLIVATQTPRADVVTGIIKANIPSRIAFQVSSALDSRVILDGKGAEKLVGKGDLLFLPPGSAKLDRAQGAWISDEEVESLVGFCSEQSEQRFEESVQASIDGGGGGDDGDEDDVSDADEEILQKCIEVIVQEQKASTSLLQRRLRLGYTRAARMVDILEQRGIVGPADGARPREVYLKGEPAGVE
ncbi:MAG: DNA translocase FtsK [Roseibacillus sp.]|nr:DNA translocase FtsK [Roseibacillus sp.]